MRIFEEYPYKLIQVGGITYVLDILDSKLSYTERRQKLLTIGSGYRVYKLPKRYTSLAQILNARGNTYIDCNGKIVKLSRTKPYPTTVRRVLGYDTTHDGKFLMFTARDSFVCRALANYVVTINFNGADVFVGSVDDPAMARSWYRI